MGLIELILTIIVWRKGWKFIALLPVAIIVIIVLLWAEMDPYGAQDVGTTFDVIAIIVLIIMFFREGPYVNKNITEEKNNDGVPPNKVHDESKTTNNPNDLPAHLGRIRLENDNTIELPKKEETSTQKTEILTKNKENMKGFKQCDKGHFYKDTLSECNYCPKTESAASAAETEILGANSPTFDNPTDKTQVFGGATQQSPSSKESFDPERTIISGGNTASAAGDAQDQMTQKRRLRAWLVSFDIEDFGIDFKVTEGKNTIGSKSSNDITIQDSEVSGLHCYILCKKDKFILTDEVSSNGTLLNGEDLEPRKPYDIFDGDEIKVGNTNLLFKTAFKK